MGQLPLLSVLTYIAHEAGTLNAHSEILLGHQLCCIEFAKRNSADSSFISVRKESEEGEGGVTSTAVDGGRYVLRNSGHQVSLWHSCASEKRWGCVVAT